MKRKRGAPKALTDADNAVFIVPTAEPEKPEADTEDPAAAEWNAFAQDHYELVEQLPLSLHRSFSLLRELDDLVQDNTARILPAARTYMALRESMLPKQKHHSQRVPSGLDLLAHVSASVESPTPSPIPPLPGQEPGLPTNPLHNLVSTPLGQLNGSAHMDVDLSTTAAATQAADIGSSAPSVDPAQPPTDLAPAHPALVPPTPSGPSLPKDSRALLTLIATLASDAVRASNEKLGVANAVYQSVDNHLRTLDILIAQHKATLPHQPSPTPSPPPLHHSPTPHYLASSPTLLPAFSSPTKSRTRRRTRTNGDREIGEDVDVGDDGMHDHQTQSIPPLRLTRTSNAGPNATTPTTIRIRNKSISKPKTKDAVDEGTMAGGGSPSRKSKSVPISKGASNSGSSKGISGSSTRSAPKPPPNNGSTQPRPSIAATPKVRRGKPPPKSKKNRTGVVGGDNVVGGDEGEEADDQTYCYCNQVSFGEMVACDNRECQREWFHLPCVGLSVAPDPDSNWFCKDCEPHHSPKKKQRKN